MCLCDNARNTTEAGWNHSTRDQWALTLRVDDLGPRPQVRYSEGPQAGEVVRRASHPPAGTRARGDCGNGSATSLVDPGIGVAGAALTALVARSTNSSTERTGFPKYI